jgi:hypothetical protein
LVHLYVKAIDGVTNEFRTPVDEEGLAARASSRSATRTATGCASPLGARDRRG